MSAERSSYTLADYVVWVFSPALVVGMVGGLVLFLLEVCYQGQYEFRLQWILSFFVVAAVLIARISMMTEIASRSWLYGIILAVLTYIGLQMFAAPPQDTLLGKLSFLINGVMLGLVWWMAHRLTWDCTYLDEESDDEGQGLLEAAGLQEKQRVGAPPAMEVETNDPPGVRGWVNRYKRYRARKKRQRTLGVWVVYLGLATLPVFGLGQSLIPVEDTSRRQYVFWLMGLYVASALGLLLTTRFLGLRRYLRSRRVEMPAKMTGVWLSSGAVLIVVLLVLGAFLPRPRAEYPLVDFTPIGGKERDASRYAQKDKGNGKDDGRPGEQAGKDGKDRQAKDKGDPGGKDKGETGNKDKQKDKGTGQKDKDKGSQKPGDQKDKPDGGTKGNQPGDPQDADSGDTPPSQPPSRFWQWLDQIAPILKWVVFGIIGLIAFLGLVWFLLKHLANFTKWAQALVDWWRNFWANLFGGKKEEEKPADEAEEAPIQLPKPFSAFPNPFDTGSADRWTTAEAAQYTFRALEAWANDRGLGRRPDETPLEFAQRLAGEVPSLESALQPFLALYLRAVYAPGEVGPAGKDVLRQFWQRLEQVNESPLSAA